MAAVTRARGVSLLVVTAVVAVVPVSVFGASVSEDFDSDEVIPMNVSSLEPTELLVSWAFEHNETSYFEVTWSPPNEIEESSANTNDTFYTITYLKPCTNYTVCVLAMDTNNTLLGSSANLTATTATSASDVSSVAVYAVADQPSQLDVSWWTEEDPGNCLSTYNVKWGRLHAVDVGEASTEDMEYTIGDLEAFTRYNVCVTSHLSDAFGGYPVCGVNRTVEGLPGRPVNVSAWAEGAEELRVSWEEPDEPNGVLTGYTVVWAIRETEPKTLQVEGNTTTTIISDLLPCTTYNITVSASTVVGSGQESSPTSATTDLTAPASPTNINVDHIDGQPCTLAVSWTQADTSGNCRVRSNIVTWWLADSGDLIGTLTLPATVKANITDLQPSTTYCVGVAAAVDNISGPYGQCVKGTTGNYDSTPRTSLIVTVSVTVVVILVAVGVGIYVFRNKLRRLKPRLRASSFGSRSRHGPNAAPFQQVNAAGEVLTTDLPKYIEWLKEDTQRGLEEEFELVREQSAQHPALTAAEYFNKTKNRFRNILPFDHSRVTLPLLAGNSSTDYINANYVTDARGKQLFVACQGPTDKTLGDFWRMVWHVGATVVVMLTNLRERGRERCALYWPTPEERSLTGEDVTVSIRGEASSDDLTVREFLLHKKQEQRQVRQYHHTTWPDFGVPSHEHQLLDLLSEVRGAIPRDGRPVVVHCSAGVGRTGTFIGLWNLMDIVDTGQPASINVQQTVLAMRECRPNMVQTPEQYLYLYKCIAVYLEQPTKWRRNGGIGLPALSATKALQGTVLAFDNPAFSKEELDGSP